MCFFDFLWSVKRETTVLGQKSRKLCSVKILQQVSGCSLSFSSFPLCFASSYHMTPGHARSSGLSATLCSHHHKSNRTQSYTVYTQWIPCYPHWVYRKPPLQIWVDWKRTKSRAPRWPQMLINAGHWYISFNYHPHLVSSITNAVNTESQCWNTDSVCFCCCWCGQFCTISN